MIVSELIKELENHQGNLEVTREFLDKIIKKKVKRSSGNKYKKTIKKEKILLKQLELLIYSNFNLTNIELSKKLGISKVHFYRLKLNIITKDLKGKYKKQSLFD